MVTKYPSEPQGHPNFDTALRYNTVTSLRPKRRGPQHRRSALPASECPTWPERPGATAGHAPFQRKQRWSFDTAIEYGAVAMAAAGEGTERTRTARAVVRAQGARLYGKGCTRYRLKISNPTTTEVALETLWAKKKISETHRDMLCAQYRAMDHTITASKRARAVGLRGHKAVNLLYGLLAHRLWDRLRLPSRGLPSSHGQGR